MDHKEQYILDSIFLRIDLLADLYGLKTHCTNRKNGAIVTFYYYFNDSGWDPISKIKINCGTKTNIEKTLSALTEEVQRAAEQPHVYRDRFRKNNMSTKDYTSCYIDNVILDSEEDTYMTKIEKVIFNDPATIVFWKDGTKTVVKCENESFDAEKGLAMAISKKVLGNKGNYFNEFKKWLPEKNEVVEFELTNKSPELDEPDDLKVGDSVEAITNDWFNGKRGVIADILDPRGCLEVSFPDDKDRTYRFKPYELKLIPGDNNGNTTI